MPNYSTLTDHEINTMLAEKMGWILASADGWGEPAYFSRETGAFINHAEMWSPCTSRDDLAVVVEYIRQTDKTASWVLHDVMLLHPSRRVGERSVLFILTCPPRVIAEACLEALNG